MKFHIPQTLNRGFTVTELAISMGIFLILLGFVSVNLLNTQHTATLSSTVEVFLTDLSQQQLKAMVGDTEGRGATATYGIHFASTTYTLFHGTYSAAETTNFDVELPTSQVITSTFPGDEVVFTKGSGEIVGFSSSDNTVTLHDNVTGEEKIIELNKYGVVTDIN